ncbi:MAG: hypothetical protein FWH07_05935 [Oscillospiraceae bacterium]|nr:hypothetical protein [Oscillospiraceae bacterium]
MRNIIRTKAVELSVIPAIAYKQKIQEGSAIKILRLDENVSAVCTIDKRTGEPVAYGKADAALFPAEAFDEAIELTCGAPYNARGNISIDVSKYEPTAEEVLPDEKIDMVDSDEYGAIIERYTDEKGRMNYALMNKDFMQFAAKSKVVTQMLSDKAEVDDILLFIVKSRATFIAGKKQSLEDKEVAALIETLDEIDPRSAFKELKAWVKKQLSR